MGRKLINRETRLQPAEYAEGHMSADVAITFTPRRLKGDVTGEDWARTAALRVYDFLVEDYGGAIASVKPDIGKDFGRVECSVTLHNGIGGEKWHEWTVRLATGILDETEWQEDFWAEMEDHWDEDGGVSDFNAAREAFERSVVKYVREIICEDGTTAADDNFRVDVRRFDAWQK